MIQDIEERSAEYAIRAVNVFRFLQRKRDGVALIFAKQFLRSASSVGANVTEAQSGESRADFIHKYSIAQKEARESRYWLKLIVRAHLIQQKKIAAMIQETEELVAIITSIIVNAKSNPKP
jgi:four helix bundle protein